jgi:hypothetical protein
MGVLCLMCSAILKAISPDDGWGKRIRAQLVAGRMCVLRTRNYLYRLQHPDVEFLEVVLVSLQIPNQRLEF